MKNDCAVYEEHAAHAGEEGLRPIRRMAAPYMKSMLRMHVKKGLRPIRRAAVPYMKSMLRMQEKKGCALYEERLRPIRRTAAPYMKSMLRMHVKKGCALNEEWLRRTHEQIRKTVAICACVRACNVIQSRPSGE